jgi:hypothetical protein
MSEFEKANQVLLSLKQAESADPPAALAILNGLVGLVQGGGGEPSLEVDEARATAFLAICEIGKALHRGQPAGHLWAAAIDATGNWINSTKRT